MNLPGIFSNKQFRNVAIGTSVIALTFLVVYGFKIGGDAFIFSFSGFLNAPLAITLTIFASSIFREMGIRNQPRRLWGGLIAGWGLWALAETIWLIYSLIGQEVPYPSLADLFWVLGYVAMGYGILARFRELPTKLNRQQKIIIWVISIVIALVTSYFIFLPMIQDFETGRMFESILNITYPLVDLFLVILVMRLLFSYEKGDYGFSWRLLAFGFIFMTAADLLFAYATWQEIYYPDMEANLISRLFIDAPYTLSFFLWFLGIYALNLLQREPQKVDAVLQPKPVPFYGHILVSTKADDTIIDVSSNANRLLNTESILGKTLAEGLTITERDGQAILKKLHEEGRIADLPIQIRNRSGYSQGAKLCGIVVKDINKQYQGSNFLLRVQVDDQSINNPLSQEAKANAAFLLEKSGSSYSVEIGNFLLEYYRAYMKELFKVAFGVGGEPMSRSLLDKFKEISSEHDWKLQFNLQTGMTRTIYPLEILRQALPILLQAAKQFAVKITSAETVDSRMREVDSQFDESIHRDVARYLKSGVGL